MTKKARSEKRCEDIVGSAPPGMGKGRPVERRGSCHSLIKQGMLEHGH